MAIRFGPIAEATNTLLTYYNYIRGWAGCVEIIYGRGVGAKDAFVNAIKASRSFSQLQGGGHRRDELVSAYCRGKLTLLAMEKLPIEEHPELAQFANLWLPVQSYYAVHGLGLAFLAALGQNLPRNHQSFRASWSSSINRYFPPPFCAQCTGGPEPGDFIYENLNATPALIGAMSNLTRPLPSNYERFVGKSLSTTRQRTLQELFGSRRKEKVTLGKSRHNLSKDEKLDLAQKVHATSVCDFLYRIRVRSNYDDPDMYLAARDSQGDAVSHYEDLLFLTEMLTEGLCTLIERKIGKNARAELENRLS